MNGFFQWVVNLISGWLPIGKNSSGEPKPFGEWLGKILWVVGIYLACYFVLAMIFPNKPNVTTIGSGGTQIIYQNQPDVAGFGCNMWRGYIKTGIRVK